MLRNLILLILFYLVSAVCCAQTRGPEEQILNFSSHFIVKTDASVNVTENITVNANERKIRHGLVRWLPTNYIDSYGIKHRPLYKVQQVKINNIESPYRVVKSKDRIIIYTGKPDKALAPGRYTFTFEYQIKDAVNFIQNADVFYWNVTGNQWDFPILKTEATVQLPEKAKILNFTGYTGKLSVRESNLSAKVISSNIITFTATKPLPPRASLSIAVSWPKGIVHKPIAIISKLASPVNEYIPYKIAVAGIIIFLIYYLIVRYRHCRRLSRRKLEDAGMPRV